MDWETGPADSPAEPGRYEPDSDPYAANAYAPVPYAVGPYVADQYQDSYPPDVYRAEPYPGTRYAAAPVASVLAPEEEARVAYLDDPDDGGGPAPGDPTDAARPRVDDPDEGSLYRETREDDGQFGDGRRYDGQPDTGGYGKSGTARYGRESGTGAYDGASGTGFTDPHPTRPDLRTIPFSGGSAHGPGPWPVQPSPAASVAAPAVAGYGEAPSDTAAGDQTATDMTDRPPAWQAPPLPQRRPGATWNEYPPADFAWLPWPDDRGQAEPRPPAFTRAPSPAPSPEPPPAFAASRRPSATTPLGAPVAPVAAVGTEPDELFRAWQGSVREASGRPGSWSGRRTGPASARRGRGWQAAKIGVPAAVIVTVGAGALLMLTGRANEMLAERSATGPASSSAPGFSASLSPVRSTLSGYPGAHGNAAVAAMWSASGLTVAVGYADGHPAVWRRAPDGDWSLVSAAVLGGLPGHLTSVVEGPLGWIAVGSVSENGTVEPMAYQSADGVTWSQMPTLTAAAGDAAQFVGVAAGPGGYLVVGRQGSGQHTAAAMWFSADLRSWSNGGNSGNTGSSVAAVVSVGNGFAAVGAEMSCHTIWTSPDGKSWTAHDLAKPDGAQSATLRSVAAGANGRVVAAGFAVKNGSDLPIVVASADGGAHQTQVVLATPAGTGTVTAVTATADGFVAVGLEGAASAQHAVTWTSKDGLTWSAAAPLTAAGSSQVTALTNTTPATASPATASPATASPAAPASTGATSSGTTLAGTGSSQSSSSVTGTSQDGASPTLITVPAP